MFPKLGGLSEELVATDKLRQIVKQLQPEVEKKANNEYELLEPIVYRQQVVAGFNYWVKVSAVKFSQYFSTISILMNCLISRITQWNTGESRR